MPTKPITLKPGEFEDDTPSPASGAVALAPGDYEDDTPAPINPYANWREKRDVGQQLTALSQGPGSTDAYHDRTAGPPSLLPPPKARPMSPGEVAFSQEENTGRYVRPGQPAPRTNVEANRQTLNPPAPVLVPSSLAGPQTAAEIAAQAPMEKLDLASGLLLSGKDYQGLHRLSLPEQQMAEAAGPRGLAAGPRKAVGQIGSGLTNITEGMNPNPHAGMSPSEALELGLPLPDYNKSTAPNAPQVFKGGTETLQGAMTLGTPAFAAGVAAAPIHAGLMYLGGVASGKTAEFAAKEAGLSPEGQEFFNVVGFFGFNAFTAAAGLRGEAGMRSTQIRDPLTGEMKEVPVRTAAVGGRGFAAGVGKAEGGGYYGAARVGPFSVRGQWGGKPVETGPVIQGERAAGPVAGRLPAESQDPTANLGRPVDGATVQANAQQQTVTEVAARAADTRQQAQQVAGMAPPPPPPPKPGEAGSGVPPLPAGMENGHLSAQTVSFAARAIKMLPPAMQPQAIRLAIGKLADWMLKSKTVVGPDNKAVNVDSPKAAQTEAIKIINDAVDQHAEAEKAAEKAQQDAAKQAEKAAKDKEKAEKELEKDRETAAQDRADAIKPTSQPGELPSRAPDTPLTRIIKTALQKHPEPATKESLNKLVGTFPVVPTATRDALVQEELTRRGNVVEDQGQANLTGEAPAPGKSREELHRWAQAMVAGDHGYIVIPKGSSYKPEIATDKKSAFTKTTVKHSPDPELNGDFYHPKTIRNADIQAAAESSNPRAALAEIEKKWRQQNPVEVEEGEFEEEPSTEAERATAKPLALETNPEQGFWFDKHHVVDGQDRADTEPSIQALIAQGLSRQEASDQVIAHGQETGRKLLDSAKTGDVLVDSLEGRWRVDRGAGTLTMIDENGEEHPEWSIKGIARPEHTRTRKDGSTVTIPAKGNDKDAIATAADSRIERAKQDKTAIAPVGKPAPLPRDLTGSKPRYGYQDKNFELEFADPRDLAAYTIGQKVPNKAHDRFVHYMVENGVPPEHGHKVREAIKALAKDANPADGPLKVPSQIDAGEVKDTSTPEVPSAPPKKPVTPQVAPIKGVTPLGAKPAAGDMKLTQDWGVESINGYSDDPMREEGNPLKDKFLGEGKRYLNAVSSELIAAGFKPQLDKKGKSEKPVRINEGGPAVAGDVYLNLNGPSDKGIQVQIHGDLGHLPMVPRTKSGVSIRYTTTGLDGKDSSKYPNNWAPVNLSASELAQRLMKHVGVEAGKAAEPADKQEPEPEGPIPVPDPGGYLVAPVDKIGSSYVVLDSHSDNRTVATGFATRKEAEGWITTRKMEADPKHWQDILQAENEANLAKPESLKAGDKVTFTDFAGKEREGTILEAQPKRAIIKASNGDRIPVPLEKVKAAKPEEKPTLQVVGTRTDGYRVINADTGETVLAAQPDRQKARDYIKEHGAEFVRPEGPLDPDADDPESDLYGRVEKHLDQYTLSRDQQPDHEYFQRFPTPESLLESKPGFRNLSQETIKHLVQTYMRENPDAGEPIPDKAPVAQPAAGEDNGETDEQPESSPARTPGEAENLPSLPESEGEGGTVRAEEPAEGNGEAAGGGDIRAGSGRKNPKRVERDGGREGGGDESDGSGRTGDAADIPPERVGADGRELTEPEPEKPAKAVKTAAELRNQNNYRIPDEYAATIGTGGEITKIKGNLDALELLKQIQAEGRERATPEEQQTLAKYVDFGGLVGMLENPYDRQYAQHYQRFQKLLTPEDIQEIRETLPNTHYTSMQMVDWMWKAIQRMGFKGGRIGEMGMGIGNFYGRLPQKLSDTSNLFGVERNPLTGAMAKLLYPDAKILVSPFQKIEFPDNSLDLVTGNVPFQDAQVTDDPRYAKLKLNLHNYFIVKSLDKIRPGGMLAVITSRYTLDNTTTKGQRAREEMAKRADLLAAIRLPDGAFKRTANTEVVADLLIFRKRAADDLLGEMPSWTKTGIITVPQITKTVKGMYGGTTEKVLPAKDFYISQYFIDNPDNVLGTHSQEGKMYGAGQYTVSTPADFTAALTAAMENIPSKVFGKVNSAAPAPAAADIAPEGMTFAPDHVKPGAFYLDEKGNIKIKQNGVATDLPPTLRTKPIQEHIKAAIALRDQATHTIDLQLETEDDDALKVELEKLNTLYDNYVKKYGHISGGKDLRNHFGEDPEYPRLLALENVDTEKKTVAKASIFTKRVLAPHNPLRELPSDPKSAMLKVLAARGYLDTKLMAELLKEPEKAIIERLEAANLIYQDPQTGDYHTADEYLSGDVREKLRLAQDAARADDKFDRNVADLEKVQPKPRTIHQIQPNLGMTWIPEATYRSFVAGLLGVNARDVTVSRSLDGKWLVQNAGRASKKQWHGGGIEAHKLVQYAMNQQQPTVWIKHSDGTKSVDTVKTAGAREKMSAIKEEFKNVLRNASKEYIKSLEDLYNRTFNSIARREFDGEHLDFPGMAEEWRAMIRGYQKAFVWRVLQEGRAGLFHAPGLGKTLTMIAAGQEAIRLKLSRKNMYAVPNNMIPQWRDAFKAAYPNANLLAVQDEDFTPENRNKLLSRIATGDWDAVLIAHSQFDTLAMAPEYEMETIREKIQEMRDVLEDLDAKDDKRTIKQIENQIDKQEARLNILNGRKKDKSITFDQMGFGMLFVDEAHAYKAMQVPTRMGNIKGINRRFSQRAFALEIKLNYMRKTHGGRGVVLATGTPLTNTIGEVYVMTKYLAPELLEESGIRNFDDWVAQFANPVTTWEYAPDGVTFKPSTALSQFVNVRELQTQFQRFSEYLSTRDAVKLAGIKLPEAHRKDLKVTITPPQEPMLLRIAERGAQLIKHPPRTPDEMREDNWLKLGTDARSISLDPRLYDPRSEDHPESKVNRTIRLVKELLDKTQDHLGAVGIFSDFFQHHTSDGKTDFNMFDDIRKKLVAAGVPRREIAIVADAGDNKLAKEAMFAGVRAGRIRVIMGSTEKMGIGVNIQDRLFALIHLDQPQRPDQVEQREARSIRSGNMYATPEWGGKAEIYRMISEPAEGKMKVWDPETETEIEKERPRAYDLQMYQLLERKAMSQEQFLSGKFDGDTLEDTAGDVKLNSQMFAMGKALSTGNPDAIRRLKVDHDLRTQELLQRNFESEISQARWDLSAKQSTLAVFKGKAPEIAKNLATWKAATDKLEAERNRQIDALTKEREAVAIKTKELEPETDKINKAYKKAKAVADDELKSEDKRAAAKAEVAALQKQVEDDPRFRVYERAKELEKEIKELEEAGILPPVKFGDLPELKTREERVEFNKQNPDLMAFVGQDIVIGGIKTSLRLDAGRATYKKKEDNEQLVYRLANSEYEDWHAVPYNYDMKRYLPGAFLNSFAQRARHMESAQRAVQFRVDDLEKEIEELEPQVNRESPYRAKIDAMQQEIADIDKRLGKIDPAITAAPEDEGAVDDEDEDDDAPPRDSGTTLSFMGTAALDAPAKAAAAYAVKAGKATWAEAIEKAKASGKSAKAIGRELVGWLYPNALASTTALDIMGKATGEPAMRTFEAGQLMHGINKMFDEMPTQWTDFIDRKESGITQRTPDLRHAEELIDAILEAQRERENEAVNLGRPPEVDMERFTEDLEDGLSNKELGQRFGISWQQASAWRQKIAAGEPIKQDRIKLADKPGYFPHRWEVAPNGEENPSEDEQIEALGKAVNTGTGRRPFEGSKAFMKQQTWGYRDAIEAGAKPIGNPVKQVMQRLQEGAKFVGARYAWHNLKGAGLALFLKKGQPMPAGYRYVDDKSDYVWRLVQSTELNDEGENRMYPVQTGRWIVQDDAARLLNNHLSKDFIRGSEAGRALIKLKNFSTETRLSWSAFHWGYITAETFSAALQVGIDKLYNRGLRDLDSAAAKEGIADIGRTMIAPYTAVKMGGQLIQYARNPQEFLASPEGKSFLERYPDAYHLMQLLHQGNMRWSLPDTFRASFGDHCIDAWKAGELGKALGKTLPWLAHMVARPLFEHYIPRAKWAFAVQMLSSKLAQYSEALADGSKTEVQLAREVAEMSDNFFGEVNWDSLHLNNWLRTALQLTFRSATWKMGSWRGLAQAGKEQFTSQAFDDHMIGKMEDQARKWDWARKYTTRLPQMGENAGRLLAMALVVGIAGSIASKVFSKKWPWEWAKEAKNNHGLWANAALEAMHFRTGKVDAHGEPIRFSFPTGLKDYEHAYDSPGRYIKGSESDWLSNVWDSMANEDAFVNYVYDPNDPLYAKIGLGLLYNIKGDFTPMSVANWNRTYGAQDFASKAARATGMIGGAPKSLDRSAALQEAVSLQHHQEHTPAQQQEWEYARSAPPTRHDLLKAHREKDMDYLEKLVMKMSYTDAMKVYEKASPQERAELKHMIRQKQINMIKAGRGR